jgi:hypothetical protein
VQGKFEQVELVNLFSFIVLDLFYGGGKLSDVKVERLQPLTIAMREFSTDQNMK